MPRFEPTTEQLHAAFIAARGPDWPTDFDEAMRDHPVRLSIVRSMASRLAQSPVPARVPTVRELPGVMPPEPPMPSQSAPQRLRPWRPTTPTQSTPVLDRKRLAAGDRDD